MRDIRIEPAFGATYGPSDGARYAAYEYGEYPESSVLYGRTRRQWLDAADTVEELKDKFPEAEVVGGSGYVEDSMMDLPGEDWD